jgi:hypothetical protein
MHGGMAEPIIAARVHAGDEHHCGGTIRKATGQYGRFLGCTSAECQTAWDENGWAFTGKRELYNHGNHGLPDQFVPAKHHGDWQHHELAVWTGKGRGDFTPEHAPGAVVQEIGLWEQFVGKVKGDPFVRDVEMAR